MTNLTTTQVQEQKERFDAFMNSTNLKKIGERYMYLTFNDEKDGRYTPYVYILRLLNIIAQVKGCMYNPDSMFFYNQILTTKALDTYLTSLK